MPHYIYIYTQQIWEWTFIFELLVGLLNILNALTWVTSQSFRSFTYSCTIQAHDFKIVQTCTNMQHVPYKYTDLHFMRPSCIKDDLLLPRDRQAYSQPKQQHDSAPAAKHRHGCRGCRGWGCVQMRQGVVERISDISAWLRCLKL